MAPRHRQIIEEQWRSFGAHVAEIGAEQEGKNKALPAWANDHVRLAVAPRYAKGIPHHSDLQE